MTSTVGKYQLGKTLGEGSSGKVKLARIKQTGESVAVKVLDKEKIKRQGMGAHIKQEIQSMKLLDHVNVVKLIDALATQREVFLVCELVGGGELAAEIASKGRMDERRARSCFRQIVEGVAHCHSRGVCHRDLKPQNLLLSSSSQTVKISDFGFSALLEDGKKLHEACGTPNYIAPEVTLDEGYDGRAADVWSCGVILFVMLAGELPFQDPQKAVLFRKVGT